MSDPSTTSQDHCRKRPRSTVRTLCFAVVTAAFAIGAGQLAYAYANPSQAADPASVSSPPACSPRTDQPPTVPPEPKPTTITTVQQAYECIFAHHYSGPVLDDRTLLTSAFVRFTVELQRRGLDRPTATLPQLTGKRDRDWAAFAKTYQDVLASLPADAQMRQALAEATMQGMIDGLHDNHNSWIHGPQQAPDFLKLGFMPAFEGPHTPDIRDAAPPMYVATLVPQSPAANAGLKLGDIIEAVDAVPVFVNGQLTAGVLDLLRLKSGTKTVKITATRPATGKTWTVELSAETRPDAPPSEVSVKLLDGGIASVVYPTFDPEAADQVLAKIADWRAGNSMRGIILDIRGNGGGRSEAVAKLLGAFVHGKAWSWDCDVKGHCTPNRTDDSVSLLNLPLVVLTDGQCFSACDAFSAGVKDLRLGPLVGARTGGVVSGFPTAYTLDDNSGLALTAKHQVAANVEIINEIGVAVDYQVPMTASDLSNGRDPAMAKALSLLTT
jgi:carboxyl-terminal processing protease